MSTADPTTLTQEGYVRRPVPFEDIVEELARFPERLQPYGIQERGRLGEYRRFIEAMIAASTKDQKVSLYDRMNDQDKWEMGIGIPEATELAEFSATFPDWSCKDMRSRIKLAISGPKDPLRETDKSQQARSAAFELAVATSLSKAGLSPVFAVNPDLSVEFQGLRVLVQCKRPLSLSAIELNLKNARRQLREDFKGRSPDSAIGVIAVSLSRAVLKEFRPGVGPFYFASSVREADEQLGAFVEAAINTHTPPDWFEPACSGVVWHLAAPYYIADEGFTWRTRKIVNGVRQEVLRPFSAIL